METIKIKATKEVGGVKLTLTPNNSREFYLTIYAGENGKYETEAGILLLERETVTINQEVFKLEENTYVDVMNVIAMRGPSYQLVDRDLTIILDKEHIVLSANDTYIRGYYMFIDNTIFVNGRTITLYNEIITIDKNMSTTHRYADIDTSELVQFLKDNRMVP